MGLETAVEMAKEELTRLTGLKLASVIGASQGDGGFHILLEMVEMSRIPPSTDVLGSYEVVLDPQGVVVKFERQGTRFRGQPVEERE